MTEATNVPSVFFLEEVIDCPTDRDVSALRCYHAQLGNFKYVANVDESFVDLDSCFYFVRRFLSPASSIQIPKNPKHFPVVNIETNIEFVTVDDKRKLITADSDVLLDDNFAVMIVGIRQNTRDFWRVFEGGFVNSETGNVFDIRKNIPGKATRKHLICVLRNRDQPPVINLKFGTYLQVFWRKGLDVTMKSCRLNVKGKVTDYERWVTNSGPRGYNIETSFSAAAASTRSFHSEIS